MCMDYMEIFFTFCSIMLGIVSGKLVAESYEEKRWTKVVVGLVIVILYNIVLVHCYDV